MSRVGRKIIEVPKGVKVEVSATSLQIQGPKGKLQTPVPPGISFVLKDSELACQRTNDERQQRAFHGLARALAQNAIKGVTEGFSKDLDIVGVGYKAAVEGNKVVFALGYSHPVVFPIPEGIKVAVDKQTRLTISGIDRQRVGQVAAEIRSLRKPDPYKQKGIRYVGEILKKKAGKAGATGAGATK
jgi:large subunit ribosomal protein L6